MAKKGYNRREFIGKTATGLISAGLGLPLMNACSSQKANNAKIIYRTLGRTELQIPLVSFGVMNSDSPALLQKALDMGIKHWDTAHAYLRGNSERAIGKILEETKSRDKIYIATKMRFNRDGKTNTFLLEGVDRLPGATEENLMAQLETSLERLRTDYIDILYIHSCYSPAMVTFEPLMKAMVKAKEAGKVRFIGVTTHKNEADVIRAAVDSGIHDVVATAYNYLHEKRSEIKKAIKYAADKGVGIVAMKTQGGVRLNEEQTIEVNHKAALKWALNDENVCTAIPGITAFDQMDLDFSVMQDLALTEQEKRDLETTATASGKLFCQNCRTCVPTCPREVEIPTLIRAYMYAEGYGNVVQAQMTVTQLPKNQGLTICRDCHSCQASCPNGINIPSRLKSLITHNMDLC